MDKIPCNFEKDCKYRLLPIGCHMSRHHLMWPRDDYRKEIDREFRNLDENKIWVCRAIHDAIHQFPPPEHPSREEMLQALGKITVENENE